MPLSGIESNALITLLIFIMCTSVLSIYVCDLSANKPVASICNVKGRQKEAGSSRHDKGDGKSEESFLSLCRCT